MTIKKTKDNVQHVIAHVQHVIAHVQVSGGFEGLVRWGLGRVLTLDVLTACF